MLGSLCDLRRRRKGTGRKEGSGRLPEARALQPRSWTGEAEGRWAGARPGTWAWKAGAGCGARVSGFFRKRHQHPSSLFSRGVWSGVFGGPRDAVGHGGHTSGRGGCRLAPTRAGSCGEVSARSPPPPPAVKAAQLPFLGTRGSGAMPSSCPLPEVCRAGARCPGGGWVTALCSCRLGAQARPRSVS